MIEPGSVVTYRLTTSDADYFASHGVPGKQAGDAVLAVVRFLQRDLPSLRVPVQGSEWLRVSNAMPGEGRGQYQERAGA